MKKMILLPAFVAILLLAGCGKDPQSYLDEAKKLVEAKKYKDAIKVYESMIAEMPESDSLAVAYFSLGGLYNMPEVAQTSKDKMTAVEYYKKVHEKFPKSEYAPMALFYAGFIYGNELGDIAKATENYNLLIKEYPEHPAAKLAKDDLALLGKTPEELLNEALKKNEQGGEKKDGEKKKEEFVHP